MISKVIYFVDTWVKTNIGPHSQIRDVEWLARRCIDDAAKAGFTAEQVEEDLGTDIVDFLTSELKERELARLSSHIRTGLGPRIERA